MPATSETIEQEPKIRKPEKVKIQTYDEWLHDPSIPKNKGDSRPFYGEYVLCGGVKNLGVNAEQTPPEKDCPGGGDVEVYTKYGKHYFFIDLKLAKTSEQEGVYADPKYTDVCVLVLKDLTIEKIRSNNPEAMWFLAEKLEEAANNLIKYPATDSNNE